MQFFSALTLLPLKAISCVISSSLFTSLCSLPPFSPLPPPSPSPTLPLPRLIILVLHQRISSLSLSHSFTLSFFCFVFSHSFFPICFHVMSLLLLPLLFHSSFSYLHFFLFCISLFFPCLFFSPLFCNTPSPPPPPPPLPPPSPSLSYPSPSKYAGPSPAAD